MKYIEVAEDYSSKFNFYIVALTFTLMGLSVQTAKFDSGSFGLGFELLGWLCLLSSGVIGLNRLSKFTSLYTLLHRRKVHDPNLNEDERKEFDAHINKEDLKIINMYNWQKWLFVTGLISVMFSRSLKPLMALFCA
jgi:hypothetical protein